MLASLGSFIPNKIFMCKMEIILNLACSVKRYHDFEKKVLIQSCSMCAGLSECNHYLPLCT